MKNHTQNAVEIPFPDSFLKNPNWAYLSISSLTFHTICFYCRQVEDSRNKLKLTCRPLAFTSYEAFLKSKKMSGTNLPVSFSAWFLKKTITLVMLYYLTKSSYLAAFALWDIAQYMYSNCLLTRLWRHKFGN